MFRHRPSPAMVVALIALFVAMGGTGYAASKLSAGDKLATVSNKKSKSHGDATQDRTLISQVVKKIIGPSGAAGTRGPAGPAGPAGPPGANGTALGYAKIAADGTLFTLPPPKNVAQSNISRGGPQKNVYCFTGLPFTPTTIQVTMAAEAVGSSVGHGEISWFEPLKNPNWPLNTSAYVETYLAYTAPGTASAQPFYVLFS
jgi:hypothetical protein